VKSTLTTFSCPLGGRTLTPFLNPHNHLPLPHSLTCFILCMVTFTRHYPPPRLDLQPVPPVFHRPLSHWLFSVVFSFSAPCYYCYPQTLHATPYTLLSAFSSLLICATSTYPSILQFLTNFRSFHLSPSPSPISVVAVFDRSRFVFQM